MDGKLQTALNSGDAPDIFMARGGGKLAAVVEAGQVQDLTDALSDDTKAALGEASLAALSVDGKVYGVPSSVLPGGIYYSKDLFAQAGITETPTTFDELSDDVDKLKAAGIAPIALGAKDAWPAAHWYYFFVLRECSQDVVAAARDRTRASATSASCAPARTSRTSPPPSRTTTASSPPPPSRGPAPPRVCSPTTRRPWSSWARGIPE